MIQQQPPRSQSLEKIAELQEKLRSLESKRKALKVKLSLRKKQFHLLVQCVHQLQDALQGGQCAVSEQPHSPTHHTHTDNNMEVS